METFNAVITFDIKTASGKKVCACTIECYEMDSPIKWLIEGAVQSLADHSKVDEPTSFKAVFEEPAGTLVREHHA
jgi:hypothetical protein